VADTARIPIIVVSFPGIRGKQRWVASVPLEEMVAEVRKRIPPDAIVELSDRHLSQEQAPAQEWGPGAGVDAMQQGPATRRKGRGLARPIAKHESYQPGVARPPAEVLT
jgi:hypothetical protein